MKVVKKTKKLEEVGVGKAVDDVEVKEEKGGVMSNSSSISQPHSVCAGEEEKNTAGEGFCERQTRMFVTVNFGCVDLTPSRSLACWHRAEGEVMHVLLHPTSTKERKRHTDGPAYGSTGVDTQNNIGPNYFLCYASQPSSTLSPANPNTVIPCSDIRPIPALSTHFLLVVPEAYAST